MFRDRILEEKKRLNLSTRTMSDTSHLHLPEETISRVLSGKTADPGVGTVLDIAETVSLKPYEVFMDATLAAEFKAFLELKTRNSETESERIRIIAENENLKATNAGLVDRIRVLEMQLSHKEELLALHDLYQTYIRKLSKKEEL